MPLRSQIASVAQCVPVDKIVAAAAQYGGCARIIDRCRGIGPHGRLRLVPAAPASGTARWRPRQTSTPAGMPA
ncbi:hypothetical protein CJO79_09520 [Ralstonia solanacearum]|nr:hypothetical protein CJO76_09535 [Ralstonia solanacearum]AXV91206.1 hypothetical protein CJO79_09520 [Ralstonia solanacearum]AXW19344.1 hypothetical protein CJO85_09570 [Ralstonia solanacearum]AXW76113.1 hypothetical protein CJO97_09515 [Ralstonia solanacearum]BEU72315.1 hypothetical protein MAFF211271_18700 [Ralstonia pseudosolanacearum]